MTARNEALYEKLEAANVVMDGKLYRMRLFTPSERQVLRDALMDAGRANGRPSYLPIEGGTGMMDELEMVNYQVYGKDNFPWEG